MEESENSIQSKLASLPKSNLLVLALFLGGLIFLGVGLMQMNGQKTASVKFERGEVLSSGDSGGSGSVKIKVDVEGQVLKPGVYSLSSDARVQDALIAAGGLAPNANRNAINLAARIADGQKIYVPAVGEEGIKGTTSIMGITGESNSGIISINTGTQGELEELPGIGPVTAQKIIDGRPYGSTEELLSKKAVGKATYEKIKNQITL